ncbi:hypothetical protein ASD83_06495 [Devosia sp. Root685]|nr:hypothetical protein ASD83_06495 [Devosia sp. Root685]
MARSRMVSWPGAANLYRVLILLVPEIAIGHRNTQKAARLEEVETYFGCVSSFLFRQMFKHMLA